ncbi:hypothetical protein HD806DRAFT_53433 [Xylariaceae sp. AK1471]|nr:hypothetical protein HD806DRAFT_53433 [Xylariaceae sp. AK1471]
MEHSAGLTWLCQDLSSLAYRIGVRYNAWYFNSSKVYECLEELFGRYPFIPFIERFLLDACSEFMMVSLITKWWRPERMIQVAHPFCQTQACLAKKTLLYRACRSCVMRHLFRYSQHSAYSSPDVHCNLGAPFLGLSIFKSLVLSSATPGVCLAIPRNC